MDTEDLVHFFTVVIEGGDLVWRGNLGLVVDHLDLLDATASNLIVDLVCLTNVHDGARELTTPVHELLVELLGLQVSAETIRLRHLVNAVLFA